MNAIPKVLLLVAALVAALASAQTTIEVPQGSGVFPTIGQINCLEEVGGRYCAATYECADSYGQLWGDLPNHNGRRAIGTASPVARARSCIITVDGEAEAVWFKAHTPGGRNTPPVGLSPVPNPKPPVVARLTAAPPEGGPMLDWLISEHGLDIAAMREDMCNHLREDAPPEHWDQCEGRFIGQISDLLAVSATPYSMCVVDFMLQIAVAMNDKEGRFDHTPRQPDGTYGADVLFNSSSSVVGFGQLFGQSKQSFGDCDADLGGWYRFGTTYPELRVHQERCCTLYREEAERIGLDYP